MPQLQNPLARQATYFDDLPNLRAFCGQGEGYPKRVGSIRPEEWSEQFMLSWTPPNNSRQAGRVLLRNRQGVPASSLFVLFFPLGVDGEQVLHALRQLAAWYFAPGTPSSLTCGRSRCPGHTHNTSGASPVGSIHRVGYHQSASHVGKLSGPSRWFH